MTDLTGVLQYLEEHQQQAVEDLTEFLRIPTVGTNGENAADMRRGAEWLRARLARAGFHDARVEETDGGHPVVRASYRGAGPKRRTVVVYGHYDVQPVDPIDEWMHSPFEPVVIDDVLYGRGAADDKGQLFLQVLAAEAWLKATGDIPVDIEFLFEGEEEIGSPHLLDYIERHREDLRADVAVISDTPMHAPDVPAICYGIRGLAALEVMVKGPYQDLHSGAFGGTVANPALILSQMLGSLHGEDGRIQVPGFYNDVEPVSEFDKDAIARLEFSDQELAAQLQVKQLWGEPGYSTLERMWLRPTLEINGITAGYQGPGQKTIIPGRATAKISCRLVPNQDPRKIQNLIEEYLRSQLPPTVTMEVKKHPGNTYSVTIPVDDPIMPAARQAVEDVFGVSPVLFRRGGSMAIIEWFQTVLHQTPLLLGFTWPNEQFHAPNEHFHLSNFRRGAQTIARLWRYYGAEHG